MKWLILVLGIASNAGASVLIKLAVQHPRQFPSFRDPLAAIHNWPFWVGLVLYGAAFVLYSAALARLPLNLAHPVMTSGAIATVALLSVVMFHEPFHWSTAAGVFLILIGVVLIALRPV